MCYSTFPKYKAVSIIICFAAESIDSYNKKTKMTTEALFAQIHCGNHC